MSDEPKEKDDVTPIHPSSPSPHSFSRSHELSSDRSSLIASRSSLALHPSSFLIHPSALGRIVVPDRIPPGFGLFYTTADFSGHLRGGGAEAVLAVVRERFGIDASLSTCVQVHGVGVARTDGRRGWRECDSCDALTSTLPRTALGIKVADCLPVTVIDPSRQTIANIHSGWRGAAQRITDRVLDSIAIDPAAALAWLGPAIRVCCFEVGEEVVEQFRAAFEDAESFVDRTRGAKPHLDLPALTASVLRKRGFAAANVIDTGLCTRCEGSIFHSYRRDHGSGGRNLAIVAQ